MFGETAKKVKKEIAENGHFWIYLWDAKPRMKTQKKRIFVNENSFNRWVVFIYFMHIASTTQRLHLLHFYLISSRSSFSFVSPKFHCLLSMSLSCTQLT